MGRPALKPGQWGKLHFERTEDRRTLVHARVRTLEGELRRFRLIGRDEYDCVRRLEHYSGVRVTTTRIVPDDRPDLLRSDSLLAELLDCWMTMERRTGRMTESTAERTAAHIRNHIDAPLGRKPLRELSVQTLDRFLLSERQRVGEGTTRLSRSILRRALQLAVRYDLMARNPAGLTVPVRLPRREPEALSNGDVRLLRAQLCEWASVASDEIRASREQLRDIVDVALGTGLRLGELLALRPTSVDLSTGKLTVSATVKYSAEQGMHISESPKRARQRRVLSLPGFAQSAIARNLASDRGGSSTIFATENRGLLHPNAARAEFRRFLRTASSWPQPLVSVELKDVNFQLLRRTVATQLAEHGGIELARDQLGHSAASTTERAYVQRATAVNAAIGETLEALFAPARV